VTHGDDEAVPRQGAMQDPLERTRLVRHDDGSTGCPARSPSSSPCQRTTSIPSLDLRLFLGLSPAVVPRQDLDCGRQLALQRTLANAVAIGRDQSSPGGSERDKRTLDLGTPVHRHIKAARPSISVTVAPSRSVLTLMLHVQRRHPWSGHTAASQHRS
jgi:hypothetical protein